MKLNYKNVELEVMVVEEKEKILVKTQNLELAKALREQGVEVLMKHTIDSFVSFYNLTLIDKKKGLVYQNLKTIGRVLKVNPFFAKGKQLYNLSLETPGKRSLFYTTSKEEYKPGDFLYLEGTLEPDAYKNRENRSKLEKIIGFEYYKFNAAKIKLVELELVKKEYKRPRYELHLHTIHSQRDAHITHEQLEHAFEEGKLAVTAITNHGINNCFPDSVHHFGEKSKRKVIPAVEIYAVDDLELKKEQELWELENQEYFQQLEELNQTMEEQELVIETFKTQLETQAVFAKGEKTIIKDQLKLANQTVRDLKKEIKAVEEQVKVLTKTKPSRGDAKRYHLVLLVKSEESTYKDEKYEFAYNPGIYELNKLITAANTEGLAQPVLKKWMGTRPTVSLSDLMKVKEYFVIGGACTSGIVNDALIEGDEEKAKRLIEIFDYLEVQPLMNNVYLTEEPDYKERYPDLESLKQLNRKIYDFAKANGKLVCFTSDAHLMEKEEQFKRALFKKSYISMILGRSEEDLTKVLSDNREEKQPWLHSYEEMVQELTNQGFSETEIEELYQNEKQIAETCRYFNNTTIFPKQMFIPEFPGVNVKEELPKIVYKNITKIYGPEPDELILARVKEELEALAKRDYEFIYYVSARLVAESEALNYPVGSRGSVGSSILALFAGISTNNALPPHYHCPKCHHHEWVPFQKKKYDVGDEEIEKILTNGLDYETKNCPYCGHELWSDGFNGSLTSFMGADLNKIPDIDLNFSGAVQTIVQDKLIEWMDGKAYGSATLKMIGSDYFKQNVLSKFPEIEKRIQEETDDEGNTFDFQYLAEICSGGLDSISKHAGKRQNAARGM